MFVTKNGTNVYRLPKLSERENQKNHCEQRSDEAALNSIVEKKGEAALARNDPFAGWIGRAFREDERKRFLFDE